MACNKCGAKRGHLGGCPTQEGKESDKGREKGNKAARDKGIMKGSGPKVCRTCDGTGMVTEWKGNKQVERTCYACKGTGER